MHVIEMILNDLIQQRENNTTVKMFENTCQFEEVATDLRTIDLISM